MRCPRCDGDLDDVEGSEDLTRCVFCGAQLPKEPKGWIEGHPLELADMEALDEEEEEPEGPPPGLDDQQHGPDPAAAGQPPGKDAGHPQLSGRPAPRGAHMPGIALGMWSITTGMLAFALALAACLSAGVSLESLPSLGRALSALLAAGALAALGSALASGRPPGHGCRWIVGMVSLGAFGFLLASSLVGGLQWHLPNGTLFPGPHLERLLVGVTLAALGIVFTIYLLRNAAWTSRVVGVAIICWILLVVILRDPLLLPALVMPLVRGLHTPEILLIGAAALCAAGMAVHMVVRGRGRNGTALGLVLLAFWPLLLVGAAAWLGRGEGWPAGLVGQTGKLTGLAVMCVGSGLAVPLFFGLLSVCRGEQSIQKDAAGAIRNAWWAGIVGAVLILGGYFIGGHSAGGLSLWVAMGGAFACLVFGLFGARGETIESEVSRGNWVARWALLPAIMAAAVALNGLVDTIGLFGVYTTPALGTRLASLFLWTVLTAWALLATWGVALKAYWNASHHREESARADLNLLTRPGMVGAGGGIVLMEIALSAGPRARAGLEAPLSALGAALLDLVQFCGLDLPVKLGMDLVSNLWSTALPGVTSPVAGLILLVAAFGLHFIASRGNIRARQVVGLIWVPITLVGVFVLAGLGTALFGTHGTGPWRTSLGAALIRNPTFRVVLFGLFAVMFVRLAGAVRSALSASEELGPRGLEARRAASFHALNAFGMLALTVALMLCALLMWNSSSEAVLYQVSDFSARALGEALPALRATAQLLLRWPGYLIGCGLILLVALMAHEETRRGHLEAHPVVGVVWAGVAVLGALIGLELFGELTWPVEPGMTGVLTLFGLLWLVLLLNVLVLWVNWWLTRRECGELPARMTERHWGVRPAQGLGRIGALAAIALGLLISVSAYWESAAPGAGARRIPAAIQQLWQGLAFRIELLRVHLETAGVSPGMLGVTSLVVLLVLAVHYLAQFGATGLQTCVLLLWSAVLLGAVFGLGKLLEFGSAGSFPPELSLILALVVVLILFVGATATGGWIWFFTDRRG